MGSSFTTNLRSREDTSFGCTLHSISFDCHLVLDVHLKGFGDS